MKNKILVVNPGPVYPIRAMNQMRTHHMVQTLSKDFIVDLATPINKDTELEHAEIIMKNYEGQFINLGSNRPSSNFLKKRLSQLRAYLAYYLFGYDIEYSGYNHYQQKVINIIHKVNSQKS